MDPVLDILFDFGKEVVISIASDEVAELIRTLGAGENSELALGMVGIDSDYLSIISQLSSSELSQVAELI